MILSKEEQEYLVGVDKTLQRLLYGVTAVNGTNEDVSAIILGLIAKQQAQTNALLAHMIHFWEGERADGGMTDGEHIGEFTFTRDLLSEGFKIRDYDGRDFYHGPAVTVDDMDGVRAVIRATSVPVMWDNMGKGLIVYPKR